MLRIGMWGKRWGYSGGGEYSGGFVRRTNRKDFDIAYLVMFHPAWDETEKCAREQFVEYLHR